MSKGITSRVNMQYDTRTAIMELVNLEYTRIRHIKSCIIVPGKEVSCIVGHNIYVRACTKLGLTYQQEKTKRSVGAHTLDGLIVPMGKT